MTLNLAAAAATMLADPRATRASLPALLYYAQGISLGQGEGPAFEGDILATPDGVAAGPFTDAAPVPMPRRFAEVLDVFSGVPAESLMAGIRTELAWRRAREGLPADAPDPVMGRTDLADEFFWAIDCGDEIVEELGLPATAGRPGWELPLRQFILAYRLEGHPLHDPDEALRLRLLLGMEDDGDGMPEADAEPRGPRPD